MLVRPGDLIPVVAEATTIPYTSRRSQILNFLHRGPVSFSTMVYDTNVGDISSLACYFNSDRISEDELNNRFGHYPGEDGVIKEPKMIGKEAVTMPRLLLYPLRGPAWGLPSPASLEQRDCYIPHPDWRATLTEVYPGHYPTVQPGTYPPASMLQAGHPPLSQQAVTQELPQELDQVATVTRTLSWVLEQKAQKDFKKQKKPIRRGRTNKGKGKGQEQIQGPSSSPPEPCPPAPEQGLPPPSLLDPSSDLSPTLEALCLETRQGEDGGSRPLYERPYSGSPDTAHTC